MTDWSADLDWSADFFRLQWNFARLSPVLNAFPPIFYTALTINGLYNSELWLFLNAWPTYFIMIPALFLRSFVPALADSSVDPKKLLATYPECVRAGGCETPSHGSVAKAHQTRF